MKLTAEETEILEQFLDNPEMFKVVMKVINNTVAARRERLVSVDINPQQLIVERAKYDGANEVAKNLVKLNMLKRSERFSQNLGTNKPPRR